MRFRSVAQALLVMACLGAIAGCSDDDNNVPSPTKTATPIVPPPLTATRTATSTTGPSNTPTATQPAPPTATNTLVPTATPTSENPPTDTPTQPVVDTPTPTETATTAEVDTPTATPTTSSAGLGVREFSVIRPGSTFNTSALAGFDVSIDPWLPATLKLVAGTPDGTGVATLALQEDVIVGWSIIDGSVACMKLLAEGSAGTIACNGGVPQGVVMSADSHEDQNPGPIIVMTGQGDPSPAGSAYFTLTRSVTVNLPAGSSVNDCNSVSFSGTEAGVFTTAKAEAIVTNPVQGGSEVSIDKTGEPFDCANWTDPSGPGQLSGPVVGFDQPPIGDVANILFLSGHEAQ